MRVLAVFGVTVLLAACQMSMMPGPSEGKKLFAENCAACHGTDARGAGQESLGIGKVPPDLTMLAARNGGEFPRTRVLSTIDGYRLGTHPDRVMPEFGASLGGNLVPLEIDGRLNPVPRELAALLAYLEDVQVAP